MKELTPKQKQFCEEYIIDLNGSKAAERAGFSAKSAGKIAFQLMEKPEIAARIKELMEKRSKKTGITQEMVINELKKIAFSNLKDIAKWNQSGVDFHDSGRIPRKRTAFISEISQVMNEYGGTTKVKLHDKVAALKLLGMHLNMFNKVVHTGEDGGPIKEEITINVREYKED